MIQKAWNCLELKRKKEIHNETCGVFYLGVPLKEIAKNLFNKFMGILRNTLMAGLVASSFAGEASSDTLSKNEVTGFKGIFCQNEDAARSLVEHFNDAESKEITVPCKTGQALVKIIRHVENNGEWNTYEIEAQDSSRHFIVTQLPYKRDGMDINYESTQFEQSTEI